LPFLRTLEAISCSMSAMAGGVLSASAGTVSQKGWQVVCMVGSLGEVFLSD
jgi:hypothetical protein